MGFAASLFLRKRLHRDNWTQVSCCVTYATLSSLTSALKDVVGVWFICRRLLHHPSSTLSVSSSIPLLFLSFLFHLPLFLFLFARVFHSLLWIRKCNGATSTGWMLMQGYRFLWCINVRNGLAFVTFWCTGGLFHNYSRMHVKVFPLYLKEARQLAFGVRCFEGKRPQRLWNLLHTDAEKAFVSQHQTHTTQQQQRTELLVMLSKDHYDLKTLI